MQPLDKPDTSPCFKLGVSSCLLGNEVRYDGSAKRDRWLMDVLGPYVQFVPVCPEVECGLGVPRESMYLMMDPDTMSTEHPRLIGNKTGTDYTEQMTDWAARRVQELEDEHLVGFVFKAKSPSSGMERVKVYPPEKKGQPSMQGVGLFAGAFMQRFPHLPVEEEGRLNDAKLRENFVEAIFAMHRLCVFERNEPTIGALVEFHASEKLLLMSHDEDAMRALGRLVADAKGHPLDAVLAQYRTGFARALKGRTTTRKHTNVLQHAMGHFKSDLSADEKAELAEVIERYRTGLVPLIVPLTLINHYVRKYDHPYLAAQTYLNPHPAELQLRNRV